MFAANAIVALYSLFEMGVSVWEISTGATLFPEILQVWFDFGHDQVLYAYINPKFENVFFFNKIFVECNYKFFLGVCVFIIVGGLSGNGVGEDVERDGHVYDVELLLRTI